MSAISRYAADRRTGRSVAALGALLLAGAFLTAPPASAADGLSMSGQVTQEGAGPASGTTVVLWGNDGLQHGSTLTGATGEYSFPELAPGLYQLQFIPPSEVPFASTWLGDAPVRQQSPYLTLDGASLGDLDATLPEEAAISGTVSYDASVPSEKRTATVTALLFDPTRGVFEVDGEPVPVESDGSYRIGQLRAGDHAVRVSGAAFDDLATGYWDDEGFLWTSDVVELAPGEEAGAIDFDELTPPARTVERLGGEDRFATAVAISQALYPEIYGGINAVWIANGLGFPDALSAGPAAANDGGPLLLVLRDSIPDTVLAELNRLDPATIVVAGGPGVVSEAVFDQLDGIARDHAYRIGGADRYETSRMIVKEAFGESWTPALTIADGRNFPDALAAGPAVSALHGPVLLVNGSATAVDQPTAQVLDDLDSISITIAGGTGAVSSRLEQSLRTTADVVEVIRDGGADRYATADALNRRVFAAVDGVILATGAGFADALAGGPAAGLARAPLFLVQKDCIPPEVMATIVELRPNHFVLLGGTGVLGSGIEHLAICGGGFGTDLILRGDASSVFERGADDVASSMLRRTIDDTW